MFMTAEKCKMKRTELLISRRGEGTQDIESNTRLNIVLAEIP